MLALCAFALLATSPAEGSASTSARTAATTHGRGEMVKTLPIARGAWQKPRTVLSLKPNRIGELRDGDRLETTAEVELSVCLMPYGGHPGHPCVGDLYAYDPRLKAKLILAPTAGATGGPQSRRIGRTKSVKCRQQHPNRNHHCVISLPWGGKKLRSVDQLPCGPDSCFINMVVSAHHPAARSGHKVVVGASDDRKRINQGLAKLSAVRYRGGTAKPTKVWRGGRVRKRGRIVHNDAKVKKQVLYSAKIGRLRAGDQLVVDAMIKNRIGHLPYNVFHRTEIVFSRKKKRIKPFGKVLASTGRASAANGFNCTQGRSAHSDVCTLRKGGVISVRKGARGPFFVNFVVGMHAIDTSGSRAWRSGHRSRVLKGGYVRVKRYRGTGACRECTTGWTAFSASRPPAKGKPAKLVSQLKAWGITAGSYDCGGRPAPVLYACDWRAEGRYGDSPRYSCERKASWSKQYRRFVILPCKEAMAAQLWRELGRLASGPVAPTHAGTCKDAGAQRYRCSYFGYGLTGAMLDKFCKGYAHYDSRRHRWSIDACR